MVVVVERDSRRVDVAGAMGFASASRTPCCCGVAVDCGKRELQLAFLTDSTFCPVVIVLGGRRTVAKDGLFLAMRSAVSSALVVSVNSFI